MTTPKISTGAMIALVATSIFLTLVTAGIIVTQTIPSNGTITGVNLGVYLDSDCTQNCTTISWGSICPGDSVNRTVYLKNTGDVPITLAINAENWAPGEADEYLTLSWDREDTTLQADQAISANLILSAASNTADLTDFSFDIVITGLE
jgi:hypothetical protein